MVTAPAAGFSIVTTQSGSIAPFNTDLRSAFKIHPQTSMSGEITSTLGTATKVRSVLLRALEKPSYEGDAYIRRPIGPATMEEFMPFLLLDDLETKGQVDGFGDHPHKGQETMTYILEGSVVHQDSNGASGTLHAGDLQAMRAGRGIIHNETPIQDPITQMTRVLQLWVALPAANVDDKPGYVDVLGKNCLVAAPKEFPGVQVKILAGESFGVKAPILTRTPVWYLDIRFHAGARILHPVPEEWNALVIVLQGVPTVAGKKCVPHETTFFNRDGGVVEVKNEGEGEARVILIAGDRLDGQEVHRYGPFVGVSEQGIRKAILDWRMGVNGFEASARGWRSEKVHK